MNLFNNLLWYCLHPYSWQQFPFMHQNSQLSPFKCYPYSQLLRIRKICSSLMDFDKHALEFASYIPNRGYPSHLIEEVYLKARRMDGNLLLAKPRNPKDAQPDDTTILASTYNPHDQMVPKIIFTNWDFLGKSHNTAFMWWMPSGDHRTWETS